MYCGSVKMMSHKNILIHFKMLLLNYCTIFVVTCLCSTAKNQIKVDKIKFLQYIHLITNLLSCYD